MSALLVAMLSVLILPHVMVRWRIAVAALGMQGLLMGMLLLQYRPLDAHVTLPLVDLLVVRGVLVPLLLERAMRSRVGSRHGETVPLRLLSLALVTAIIVLAFGFARRLEPLGGEPQLQLAVAASTLLLGLYQLSMHTSTLWQAIGALTVENAIALFALDDGLAGSALPGEVGLLAVFLVSVFLYAGFMKRLSPEDTASPIGDEEDVSL